MANLIRKENTSRNIQLVFVAIRKNRPWDTRPAQNMYTTAQEKYLIELIKEGHCIPNEITEHVVNQCTHKHTYSDGRFSCCYGYILIGAESEHLDCKNGLHKFHKLNKHLYCHEGFIYYPVDMLKNVFGDWRPDETHTRHDIQEVYELIKQKWPYFCEGDDAYKYTLKYLVDLVDKGVIVSKDVQRHVINGCTEKKHSLDDIFTCSLGRLSFHDSKKNKMKSRWNYLADKGEMERKQYPYPANYDSTMLGKKILKRICHRDFISSDSSRKILITPEEKHLIDCFMSNEDVPNDVVSHVVEGCHIQEHRLTEEFVCLKGYICKKSPFLYHSNRNDDYLSFALSFNPGRNALVGHEETNIRANIAPPPRDYLDNNAGQQRFIPRPIRRWNIADFINELRGENFREDIAENPAPNIGRNQNLAPPPEEFDI